MFVPLSWLSEYVKLPKSERELTDKLTMIGHMLDTRKEVAGDVVIDLELRGNRSDLFGLIGIARDVSAAFHTPLTLPPVTPLPKTDPKSLLIKVLAPDVVERFLAFELTVTVKPSPDWLVSHLAAYGMPSINNVVDITNFVMIETGEPMHAYDMDKLTGGHLTLRMAKKGEQMKTLQGTTLTFSPEDLVIADDDGPQGTALIGGDRSRVEHTTKRILLEAAVYNQANVRRTSRRLAVRTEAGTRHEKLLDPNTVPHALARALHLLVAHADAAVCGQASDQYIKIRKPLHVTLPISDISRLTGTEVPTKNAVTILKDLDFGVTQKEETLEVTAPSFRTDIEGPADIVEEIIRMWGYEHVPVRTLSGILPPPSTYPAVSYDETLRDILIQSQINEVITSTIIAQTTTELFAQTQAFPQTVALINAPDPAIATLRPSLLPNLVAYAKRSLGFRQKRIAFFELGRVYSQKGKNSYHETPTLGLIMGGVTAASWNKKPEKITFFDLKGVVETLADSLGLALEVQPHGSHPSLGETQGTIITGTTTIGYIGELNKKIASELGLDELLYCAELNVELLQKVKSTVPQPYVIAPLYPPMVEDISLTVPTGFHMGPIIHAMQSEDQLIQSVVLLDIYNDKRMLRITYADPARTLTNEDIAPIRKKLIDVAEKHFGVSVNTA
jgi:phenylalanyl-tRNA synthetase beta chain